MVRLSQRRCSCQAPDWETRKSRGGREKSQNRETPGSDDAGQSKTAMVSERVWKSKCKSKCERELASVLGPANRDAGWQILEATRARAECGHKTLRKKMSKLGAAQRPRRDHKNLKLGEGGLTEWRWRWMYLCSLDRVRREEIQGKIMCEKQGNPSMGEDSSFGSFHRLWNDGGKVWGREPEKFWVLGELDRRRRGMRDLRGGAQPGRCGGRGQGGVRKAKDCGRRAALLLRASAALDFGWKFSRFRLVTRRCSVPVAPGHLAVGTRDSDSYWNPHLHRFETRVTASLPVSRAANGCQVPGHPRGSC